MRGEVGGDVSRRSTSYPTVTRERARPASTPARKVYLHNCGRRHRRSIDVMTTPATGLPHEFDHTHSDVSGGWLRAASFGAMDGLVSNTALIAGVAAAANAHAVVLSGIAGYARGLVLDGAGRVHVGHDGQRADRLRGPPRTSCVPVRIPHAEMEELVAMLDPDGNVRDDGARSERGDPSDETQARQPPHDHRTRRRPARKAVGTTSPRFRRSFCSRSAR